MNQTDSSQSTSSQPDTPDASAQREANKALLRRVFDAMGSGDAQALAQLYTEDYTLELPYAEPEPIKVEGLANVGAYLGEALNTFKFTLTLGQVYDLVDPDMLIAEYTSQGEVTTTGAPYANSYIGIWRFRGGQVCGTKEWYNPQISAAALAAQS